MEGRKEGTGKEKFLNELSKERKVANCFHFEVEKNILKARRG